MNKKIRITVSPTHSNGSPNYRFFKLIYTAALRLKTALSLTDTLAIDIECEEIAGTKYKKRTNFLGHMTLNESTFDDIVLVLEDQPNSVELVTFWKHSQRGDAAGSKGGAHQFAEAYMGYMNGKVLESQIFSPALVAQEVSDLYNSDSKFNITAWIIQKAQALNTEPPRSIEPIENPSTLPTPAEFIPELFLINKWKTDVRRSGIFYTNYEVDACIKDLCWGLEERIQCQLHWEDGKFLLIEDFGNHDRYTDTKGRLKVFNYLQKYSNTASRVRLILTVKGDSTQWTIASSTMIKRLNLTLS
jgi:hypothetical protein